MTAFQQTGVMDLFGGDLNLLTFPEINIGLVYVAFPIAAALGRRRSVVGFMPYGFMLVNGLTHMGGTLRLGGGILDNPGNVTGLFCFIPLFCWFLHVCRKDALLDDRGLAAAIVAGVVQHLGVFSVYVVNLAFGPVAAMAWTPFMCFIGIGLAFLTAEK